MSEHPQIKTFYNYKIRTLTLLKTNRKVWDPGKSPETPRTTSITYTE